MSEKQKMSRVQKRNRAAILASALDVFSSHGYRGATLDQIASTAGMSKPNLIYYFASKESIFVALLNRHMDEWLAPLRAIEPSGDPLEQILRYVRRKIEMSRVMPRESRLFANEIVQGAPRMKEHLSQNLKVLFDEKRQLLANWMEQGKLAKVDPEHLIFSIWATTQHYADFEAQIDVLSGPGFIDGAEAFLDDLYRKLLTPN